MSLTDSKICFVTLAFGEKCRDHALTLAADIRTLTHCDTSYPEEASRHRQKAKSLCSQETYPNRNDFNCPVFFR
ncbi:MAG: hypothetical protein EWV76_00480 [Microcystis novacekii Mn_MB_F_20050700_S1]|uniref:Uncharacterized protein n=1 Tax=Microcystis novacekii Mn_MB_F_20050700_S1D TaxID=2486266 RepID=A0A552J3I2_9CHRO|nr:MAG: hypothetical protein EWV54_07090 [Microcystis novacekii Mn_MB_F_20050700_S1D]TRU93463.1 MAG: hypothetical protein EWV76_00480 [Microcystis novacekii Mn_MB_F_20050700_S1]